ncbi:MAG TPA: hypothetical protein VF680_09345 [Allosphingosinicella sp.]|jgi:hypothetical protein
MLIEVLGQITTAAECHNRGAERSDWAEELQVRWADVSGLTDFLADHTHRLTTLISDADWLSFAEEGIASGKPDVAQSCRTLHGVLRGRNVGKLTTFAPHYRRRAGSVTAIARFYCDHFASLGPAISTWAQAEVLPDHMEATALRKLFYVGFGAHGAASAMLVSLTHFDDDHLPSKRMAELWRAWSAHRHRVSTVVITQGKNNGCYWFHDDDVVHPIVTPQALVSFLPLGKQKSFVCGAWLSSHSTVPSDSGSQNANLPPVLAGTGDDETDLAEREIAEQATYDHAGMPMPLFSTVDMFFGRRRKLKRL